MPRSPGSSPLASLGEFGLIDRLRRLVPAAGPGVTIGIGDDAAVLQCAGPVVATCDIQVEGVHFTWALCGPEDVGWRALAVSLSDIAAMGGVPRYALISLALPAETTPATIEGIYRGLAEIAGAYDVRIVGGNISRTTGPLIVDVTALGSLDGSRHAVTRAGARPGDGVWVTGTGGGAAAGRFLLEHPEVRVPGAAEQLDVPLSRIGQTLPRPGGRRIGRRGGRRRPLAAQGWDHFSATSRGRRAISRTPPTEHAGGGDATTRR